MANTADGGSGLSIPTLGVVSGGVVLLALPFVTSQISAETGLVRVVLWLLAILVLAYIAVVFRRIQAEHGLLTAVRWLVTGRLPRNDAPPER